MFMMKGRKSFMTKLQTRSLLLNSQQFIKENKKVFFLSVLIAFFTLLMLSSQANDDSDMEKYLRGPMEPTYPELLEYIRKEVLVPPSTLPYELLGERNPANKFIEESETFYSEVSRKLFESKTGGFFVEAGALDGESMSNTLWLELKNHWRGLLVEPDQGSFTTMKQKNRRAWLANACLSPTSYPQKMQFATKSRYVDPKSFVPFGSKMQSMNGLASYVDPMFYRDSWFKQVQCFPLESLLLAVNTTKVDLLSLDVEGPEREIIKSFPFHKITVEVVFLEWKIVPEFNEIETIMKSNGYKLYKKITYDSVFIRKGSIYDK